MKRPITRDKSRDMDWHRYVTEFMVREHFRDRGLDSLLGDVRLFQEKDDYFMEFEYKQPKRLEERGVDWLHTLESDPNVVYAGHGTYWESVPRIVASGSFLPSNGDTTYGEREYHGASGVYVAPPFDSWATYYSWPCNVFGNQVFYGIGSLGGRSQEKYIHIKKISRSLSTIWTCSWTKGFEF